jgi:type VI secretion system protein VasG
MTSNLGSDEIAQFMAREHGVSLDKLTSMIRPVLSRHFKPALLARMTVVPYAPLDPGIMADIVNMKISRIADRMMEAHQVRLDIDDAVCGLIAERCLEVESGARNIDHIMNGTVLPMMSQEILGYLSKGALADVMTLSVTKDGHFTLSMGEKGKKEKKPAKRKKKKAPLEAEECIPT